MVAFAPQYVRRITKSPSLLSNERLRRCEIDFIPASFRCSLSNSVQLRARCFSISVFILASFVDSTIIRNHSDQNAAAVVNVSAFAAHVASTQKARIAKMRPKIRRVFQTVDSNACCALPFRVKYQFHYETIRCSLLQGLQRFAFALTAAPQTMQTFAFFVSVFFALSM